jgi:single-stranded DNA-binding protein
MKGTIVGYMGRDPETKVSQKGNEYVSFSVAENNYNSQIGENETLWYNCRSYGNTGGNILKHFNKGKFIVATGELGMPFIGSKGDVQMSMLVTSFDFGPKDNSNSDGGFSVPIASEEAAEDFFA